jgi:trigger factor
VGEVVELPADEEDTSQGPEPRPLRRVKIERTYRKVLPALDDEFARSLSDASGLEELRTVLRKNLLEERQRRAEEALRSAAVDALIQRNEPLHVPPSVVEEEAVRLALGELRRLGVREEALERVFKERGEELLPVLRPIAEREVKAGILLNSVAREAGVEVSDEEVQAVIQAQLERVPEGRSDLKGRVRSRQNRERQRDLLLLEKTIDTILRESQIVED